MVEQIFKLSVGDEKAVEKVIFDDNIHYLHMVFNKNEGLPEHFSNSNVYMTVIRGKLSIGLDEQDVHEYEAGTLLKIPFQTKMNVKNLHDETLELIVIKAPAPQKLRKQRGNRMKKYRCIPEDIYMIPTVGDPDSGMPPAAALKISPMIGIVQSALWAMKILNL
jgi:quercetin dioxygenase-like cupin family protein